MSEALRVVRYMITTSRARRVHAMIVGALAVTALGGCSAVLNMDTDQCKVDADCVDRFGTAQPFLCVNNLCERPLCATDSDCRSRGDTFATSICDAEQMRCTAAQCLDSTNCVVGQACDTSTNRCVASNCQTTEQCFTNNASPTVQCVGGLCVDQTWGCIGQGDNRAQSNEPATLKIPFIDGTTGKPAPVALTVLACSLPAFDAQCANPLAVGSYDVATGVATITGLTPRTPIRIKMDPPKDESGADIVPIDFYTPRTPVGITDVPPIRLVFYSKLYELVAALGGAADTIDPTYGSFYGIFFDCQDKTAANMKLSILEQGAKPPLILYFDENNLPHLEGLTMTTSTGMFSTLNVRPMMPVNVTTTLVATLGSQVVDRLVNKYLVTALTGRVTTVHFYPRDYAKTQ